MRDTHSDPLDAIRAAHHQIGNSLQSVASLLALESRAAPPEVAGVLSEAGRRVRAVMRLHQRLQVVAGAEVRLDDLLGDVCRDVVELDTFDRKADVRLDLHPCVAGSSTSAALAMITAELVGNALEHGLAHRSGIVQVSLRAGAQEAALTVSDDGVGSSEGEWAPGFGLSLVSRIAAGLGAPMVQEIGPNGSRYEFILPGVWTDPAP